MEAVLYIGLSQSFFASFIVITKKPSFIADKILALWLLLISLEMALSLMDIKIDHFFIHSPIILMLPLIYAPLLYIYVLMLISENPKFKIKYLCHALPLIFFIISYLIFFPGQPTFQTSKYLKIDSALWFRLLFAAYFLCSVMLYSWLVQRKTKKHKEHLKDRFSHTLQSVTLNWIKVVLFIFILTYILFFGSSLLFIFYAVKIDPYLYLRIGLTFFTFVVSYFGIKQPALFKAYSITNIQAKNSKYKRSGLDPKEAMEYQNKLLEYMQKEKPYLLPEITIQDLAEQLDISRHYLTQILNEGMLKNFYTFINEYRVEEVKRRIKDRKYNYLTLVAIGYECGFNSKSAFNAIFKKTTGLTPSEYRQKIKS